MMRKMFALFTLLALACMPLGAAADIVAYDGSVTIESKTVSPGSNFTLDLLLGDNSVNITSMKIPLTVNNPDITCTGVDFSGSIIEPGISTSYDLSGGNISIYFIPPQDDPLPVFSEASGLLATLQFHVASDAQDADVTIGALNEDNSFSEGEHTFYRWNRIEITDDIGSDIMLPDFYAGVVAIRNTTDVDDDTGGRLPLKFNLAQNFPNPFNPSTTISFSLPERVNVRLDIFDILGRQVDTPINGFFRLSADLE
jgi:hypothetical protein